MQCDLILYLEYPVAKIRGDLGSGESREQGEQGSRNGFYYKCYSFARTRSEWDAQPRDTKRRVRKLREEERRD